MSDLITNPWRPRRGDLVRYGKSPTALAFYHSSSPSKQCRRHYGDHVLGGSVGFDRMDRPTEEDIKQYGARGP